MAHLLAASDFDAYCQLCVPENLISIHPIPWVVFWFEPPSPTAVEIPVQPHTYPLKNLKREGDLHKTAYF